MPSPHSVRLENTHILILPHSMEKLSKITVPASDKLRQIQKIVQDIKKNDDSIFSRLKRLKNKGPPKVPARDYPSDNPESEQSSDSEFDNDLYEEPQGEYNYEPPPCERVFTPPRQINYTGGDYLDTRPGRQTQSKLMTPFPPTKPPVPGKSKQQAMYDEDYIDPEDDTDDNYIDPSEKENGRICNSSSTKTTLTDSPDLPSASDSSECSQKLQPPTLQLPPKPSPRNNIKKAIICPEPEDEDDYEICIDDNDDHSLTEEQEKKTIEERRPSIPVPLPRETKNPKLLGFLVRTSDMKSGMLVRFICVLFLQFVIMFPDLQKPSIPSRDQEARDPAPTVVFPPTTGFHLVKSLQRENFCQKSPPGRGSFSHEDSATRQQEEEAGVYKKPWYVGNCDRKTAEDALIRSAKDGSYLLRKSSGVDALQPYTLVVLFNGRVYNIPVRYIPNTKQYALGKQKNREERFGTVSEIIENHQKNTIVLVDMQSNTKDTTSLRHAVKL
ncbi:B-cell linker protein [Bagarius yarrelli]|uniref:B-cell linker protein n=1 Tax=Bagarius yarrelli TaxID=175774 RepID=A0A556TMP4_BAGYA|nr:B-cell linker protein [Bagarius yarrelli]